MEDSAIIDLYWAREERALSETDAKYGGYCRSIAHNILKNREDSEECVSDTWLHAWNPHNDGGYAVEDFDTVDPALGTNKDLENLTRELRKAGISLCLDFVMNHTASTHRWAMAAKAGDPWFQAYYHLYEDRTIPDQYEHIYPSKWTLF